MKENTCKKKAEKEIKKGNVWKARKKQDQRKKKHEKIENEK